MQLSLLPNQHRPALTMCCRRAAGEALLSLGELLPQAQSMLSMADSKEMWRRLLRMGRPALAARTWRLLNANASHQLLSRTPG